jgi:glycosyltransferase involved in cell wall biosynthesis
MLIMPHGLSEHYATYPFKRGEGKGTSFLHMASAPSFRARKGTIALIKAFHELDLDHTWLHLLGTTDPHLASNIEAGPRRDQIVIEDFEKMPMPPGMMRAYYNRAWDALVLPSRAEAFGMCAVEARSQGLPVILTNCSGHADHVEPWDCFIKHGGEARIAVNGIPNGMAPSVAVKDITAALRDFIDKQEVLQRLSLKNCRTYYQHYAWKKATGPLARHINKIGKKFRKLSGVL